MLAKISLSVFYGKSIVINNQVDLAEMRKGECRVRYYISNSYSLSKLIYHNVASSNTSHLEAHAGFFGLLIKGIFDSYVL